jgi:hypothetical protein
MDDLLLVTIHWGQRIVDSETGLAVISRSLAFPYPSSRAKA